METDKPKKYLTIEVELLDEEKTKMFWDCMMHKDSMEVNGFRTTSLTWGRAYTHESEVLQNLHDYLNDPQTRKRVNAEHDLHGLPVEDAAMEYYSILVEDADAKCNNKE